MRGIKRYRSFQPIIRAVALIASVAVLATGVTFAALQSQQAVLTGNSIQSATADLRISGTGSTYSNTKTGFTFAEVIPGGPAAAPATNSFYLKNYGTPVMALKIAVSSVPVNTDNVNLDKVYIVLNRVDTNTSQKFSLASLVSAYASGGTSMTDNLAGGQAAQYKAQVSMDADAFSGQKADISGIDIVFNGTAVTQ